MKFYKSYDFNKINRTEEEIIGCFGEEMNLN